MNARDFARRAFRRLSARKPSVSARQRRLGTKRYRVPGRFGDVLAFEHNYEPWLDPIFAFLLKISDGTVIDVGANRGQTLAKILRIDPARGYIGFEPQPICAAFIERFIKDNQLLNARLVPVGLSNQTGLAEIHFGREQTADTTASLVRAFRPNDFYTHTAFVPVFQGDTVLEQLAPGTIAAIKVDVEGGELEVLQGFSATMKAQQPPIVFEVLNNYLAASRRALDPETIAFRSARIESLQALLHQHGYRIFNIRGGQLHDCEKISPATTGDLSITDYLAIPKALARDLPAHLKV